MKIFLQIIGLIGFWVIFWVIPQSCFRNFGDNALNSANPLAFETGLSVCPEGIQYTSAKQFEFASAIHQPFDDFETIDLTFHLAITPFQSHTRFYNRLISANSIRK